MFPSHCRIFTALTSDMETWDRSESKYESEQRLGPSATEWSGYQLPALRAAVVAQKHKQSLVRVGRPEFVESISDPHVQNYETMTIAEVTEFTAQLNFPPVPRDTTIYSLQSWFDFDFTGKSAPSVTVYTSPFNVSTHWQQVTMNLLKPVTVKQGETASGTLDFKVQSKRGHRLEADIHWSSGQRTQQAWVMSEDT